MSPEDETPLINYSIMLHTTRERFEGDLARFRAILATVRIFEPQQ